MEIKELFAQITESNKKTGNENGNDEKGTVRGKGKHCGY